MTPARSRLLLLAPAALLLAGLGGCTSVQKAAQTGDVASVVKALTAGKDVNMVDSHGRPLLSIAAERGQLPVIRELISRQADLEKKDNRGMTPLYIAAGHNQLPVVQELVAAGAVVDSLNTGLDMTPLLPAAESGYKAVVEYLLGKGAKPDARTRDGQTALIRLAHVSSRQSQSDNLGTAQLLHARVRARAGAKGATAFINQADASGLTALHRAVGSNDTALAAWLLQNGANANAVARVPPADLNLLVAAGVSTFATPLEVASGLRTFLPKWTPQGDGTGEEAAAPAAGSAPAPATPVQWMPLHTVALHCAAGEANLKALLAGGANARARAGDGRTALQLLADCERGDPALLVKPLLDKARHKAPPAEFQKFIAEQGASGSAALIRAVARGHAETVRLLLGAGASPNAVGADGKVALHLALDRGDTATLQLLLAARANPNLADAGGATPLLKMVEKGNAAAVQALLGAGARPNVADAQGVTPLLKAVAAGNLELVKVLLAAKGNPDHVPAGGEAALHVALGLGQPAIASALLGAGANPDLLRRDGTSALYWSVRNGRADLVQVLLTHRADRNRRDQKGSPLYWSVVDNRLDILQLLIAARADVNLAYEGEEWTPLHKAAHDGNAQAYQMLLAAGADRSRRNSAGKSADDLGREREQRLAAEAAAAAAAAAAARQREAAQQQNSFQWGKLAALSAGMALGGVGELDSGTQADLLLGAVRDSMAGQQGVSGLQQSANAASQRLGGAGSASAFSSGAAVPAVVVPVAGMASGGGAFTAGTYMMDGGGYTMELSVDGNALVVREPAYNKTTVYQGQGNGIYSATTNVGRFSLRAIDGQTVEVWKEGNTPSRMNLVSSSGSPSAGGGDDNSLAIAEHYRSLSQSDPANAQAWTACSAAALKRGVATGAEADAYGRQMASMLRQIIVDDSGSPCRDAIPDSLW